jgi:azurin
MQKKLHLVSLLAAVLTAGATLLSAAAGPARLIEITGNDQMQYNVTKIDAKAGETLKVVFTNVGTLPKEAMGHNWILLKAGTDITAFATDSMMAKDTDYIAPKHKDKIIAFIGVKGPKQSGEATFTVPAAGTYTYLCSFPGHYMIMKGTLTVK